MLRPIEILMPKEMSKQWPELLENAGVTMTDGPTLREMHERAKKKVPNLVPLQI